MGCQGKWSWRLHWTWSILSIWVIISPHFSGCNCDLGGSASPYCDKYEGQCDCRPRITGRSCDMPLTTHYFPTLYQFQHEAEDGTTMNGGPVRFSYNETQFPDFSWRGYAVYSQLQVYDNIRLLFVSSVLESMWKVLMEYAYTVASNQSWSLCRKIILVPDCLALHKPRDFNRRWRSCCNTRQPTRSRNAL